MNKKYITPELALVKLQQYCAYQERCHQEVRSKLIELGIYGDALEEIIAQLISDDFLNEQRFAIAYAGGKFRIKNWGRVKIKQELKFRKISDYCIREAIKEIQDADCLETIHALIAKKAILSQSSIAEPKFRLSVHQYLLRKGFENQLIVQALAGK